MEVTDVVKTQQKILDGLDKGTNCHKAGLSALNAAKSRQNRANDNLRKQTRELAAAASAQVDMPKFVFNSLRENQCGQFFRSIAYVSAKGRFDRETREKRHAEGEVSQAKKAVRDADAAHKRAVLSCRCRVEKQHKEAWTAANKSNAANDKAWKKSHYMLCVLNGTPQNKCRIASTPRVRKPRLASGVAGQKCSGAAPAHFRGCYQDNGSRDFKHGPKRYGYTSTKCMDACKGYKFVALQNNGWCSCDNSYSSPSKTYPKKPSGECNKGGTGKGGPWRNAVYTNVRMHKAPAHFRGCYVDNGSRDFKHGPKRYGYSSTSCMNACKSYKFVALQNNGWCSCDNTYSTPSSHYRKRPSGECNKGGTGKCGPWRNAVYTNARYSKPKAPAHFRGCYQNNGSCSCDNSYSTPSNTYRKRPSGECNQGGTGKGGPWRNAVYTNARYSAPKSQRYLGCYQDNGSRDFRHGPKRYGYRANTCAAACKSYTYVALQNGG